MAEALDAGMDTDMAWGMDRGLASDAVSPALLALALGEDVANLQLRTD